jgi:hypothetical protein
MNKHRQLLDKVESLGIVVLGGIFIMGVFATVVVMQKRRRQQRQIALARQRALASASSNNAWNDASACPNNIVRQRKTHIEAYLVTKPAMAHDILCDCARGVEGAKEEAASTLLHFSAGGSVLFKNYFIKSATAGLVPPSDEKDLEDGSSSSHTNIDGNQNEGCTICFESFEPSELVSWSANPGKLARSLPRSPSGNVVVGKVSHVIASFHISTSLL